MEKSPKITFYNHIMKLVNEESEIIKSSTVPIYLEKNNKPKLLGSGVLLKFDKYFFLISAAHVLLDNGLAYYVPYNGDFYNISGHCTGIYAKDNEERKKDKFDFGILKLDSRSINGLKKDYAFIDLKNIEINHALNKGNLYIVAGFPGSKNKSIIPEKKLVKRTIYLLWNNLIQDIAIYKKVKGFPHSHLLVKYDEKNVKTPEGNIQKGIDPHGISGGGIWYISDYINLTEINKKLVAIAIEYHKPEKIIMGVRIHIILEALKQLYNIKIPERTDTFTKVRISFA